ncbi:unnamed protein product [Prorocentrum cordatum]|uniref:Methyltransferase n=1 Tax=Prorocentrum cordatum TaxID=2364126 RepID=A0ABN9X814_9DINO|nr:unnamed protein product [Polarella glacialis]
MFWGHGFRHLDTLVLGTCRVRPVGMLEQSVPAREVLRGHGGGGMMARSELRAVLGHLAAVGDVEGAVVELGCNAGSTSVLVRRLLDHPGMPAREFHVYDSWEGLPEKHQKDGESDWYASGSLASTQEQLQRKFRRANLKPPKQHKGWFSDAVYPDRIAFAFFDGDFYQSILDSFQAVYPRLVPGARVVIDDYGASRLPGCKLACDEFLADKPEKVIRILGYGIERFRWESQPEGDFSTGGVMIKQAAEP